MDVTTYWQDQERLRLYHGTSVTNARSIEQNGFEARLQPRSGMYRTFFSSSIEQAWGYSRMGGEFEYMSKWYDGEPHHVLPEHERAVVVVEIPPHMVELTGGGHFSSREAYEANREIIIEVCSEDPDIALEFSTTLDIGVEYIVDILTK